MFLVTGTSGFIGKHLLRTLIGLHGKENVVALTSVPLEDCQYLLHDNYNFDGNFFLTAGYGSIHTVIHVGAFTPKSGKEANNPEGCYSNINTTQKLLHVNLPLLKRFIFLSTLDVYDSTDTISEETGIKPASLYGLSKYYCERMIEIWGKEKETIFQVLRVGHVYGPGEEFYQKIIPVTFRRLIKSQPLQIWGSGEEKRSFIFINDIIKAIIASLELKESIGPVNLVGAQVVSIRQLMDMMILVTGINTVIENLPATVKARNFVFDNDKMRQFLLKSEIPLLQGLSEEWEYMKQLPA